MTATIAERAVYSLRKSGPPGGGSILFLGSTPPFAEGSPNVYLDALLLIRSGP